MQIQVTSLYGCTTTVSLKEWVKEELDTSSWGAGQIETAEQRIAAMSEVMSSLIEKLVEAGVLPLDSVSELFYSGDILRQVERD